MSGWSDGVVESNEAVGDDETNTEHRTSNAEHRMKEAKSNVLE